MAVVSRRAQDDLMRSVMTGGAAALLLMAGCAGPEAVWVGEYQGTYECTGRYVESGDPYTEGPADQLIRIDSDEYGAFIAGQCMMRLDVASERTATIFVGTSCAGVLPSGRRVELHLVNSGLYLEDRSRLNYTIGWGIDVEGGGPGDDVNATCTFSGLRSR